MTIKSLLALESGAELSVMNESFVFQTKLELSLGSGDIRHWFFDGPELMLAVAPADEEVLLFHQLDEEFDPNEEGLLYNGKEFEFDYAEDMRVSAAHGDEAEEDDRLRIEEYIAMDGERLRLVTNESVGESQAYLGHVVVPDDILEVS